MTEIRFDPAQGCLRLIRPDGTADAYPYLWLRDNDPAGFHPQTGERSFDLLSVPPDLAPQTASVADGMLHLFWPDGAETRVALDWLAAHRPGHRRPDPADVAPHVWTADLTPAGIPRAAACDLLTDDAALLDWIVAVKRVGLALVTGLADDREAGLDVARRVGFLRETNFGRTFEVMSKPDPNNLAYTADALPLHTDLPNQDLPPGMQFLHCLANEAEGGGSVFADGFALAEALANAAPDAADALADIAIPFRFHDSEFDIRSRKPVLVRDRDGRLREVCYNAHIADIADMGLDEMTRFYPAYRRFMALTRDPAFRLELKLAAGEMVVFDNRRVLHGRSAFDPATGRRHLRGAYVDRGEWDSRLRILTAALNRPAAA
ncbi:TauD/TfdA family dioxygenase [Oceanomicrobium pacificus]|uniref:Gamma-butyrobetaine hydroxylase n=1 Tax=Oceanomicrobium pacificus TaxID=2692916 RepID=A0A6B0TL62_9RHOB|nr:TauD/TfdA family dioxygenase [Oceanomicrobium pacificus]MXU64616.1 gamma-butyrobetaine hydroxylase [Oceanomicrobium pacificus]